MIRAVPVPVAWRPDLPVFASGPFLRAVGDDHGWLGGLDDDGTLRCVLPYTLVRRFSLRLVRFRVETLPWGGPLTEAEERGFLDGVIRHFRTAGADMVIPATTNTVFRTYPAGAVAAPYGTCILDLTHSEEELWGRVSASHRRKIRVALRDGVRVREGGVDLGTVHAMIRDTFARSGLSFMGLKPFEAYVGGLGSDVKILSAEQGGALQGCMVAPFSGYGAYYVYGGSRPQPRQGAMHLLHWEAIRTFRGLGVRRYDFVGVRLHPEQGSRQEGLRMFKERFGGELRDGFMWKYPLRRVQSLVYTLGVRLLRGGDIVDREHRELRGYLEARAARERGGPGG
jgi:hypothetical protein